MPESILSDILHELKQVMPEDKAMLLAVQFMDVGRRTATSPERTAETLDAMAEQLTKRSKATQAQRCGLYIVAKDEGHHTGGNG